MLKNNLEKLYSRYNARRWVHPDPLEFLYAYPDRKDREIAALVASSLAYGRVAQILRSVSSVLEKMGPSPYLFIEAADTGTLKKMFSHFKHRFTKGEDILSMLQGVRRIIRHRGSLYECFLSHAKKDDETYVPALSGFTEDLLGHGGGACNSLLPLPARGSACKRWNLFLRWMVRHDRVDPGGWDKACPSKLVIPLDTHMYRICLGLRLTLRKSPDMKTAVEITRAFRRMSPDDPVKYDFALTRLGIRNDPDQLTFLDALNTCHPD